MHMVRQNGESGNFVFPNDGGNSQGFKNDELICPVLQAGDSVLNNGGNEISSAWIMKSSGNRFTLFHL